MRDALKQLMWAALREYPSLRALLAKILARNVKFQKVLLQLDYLEQTIRNQYGDEALKEKRFYNIGAGNQRSRYPFWSYLDLKSDTYDHSGIDLFFNLESYEPLPIDNDKAEVIFSSFVIEHVSKKATQNLAKEALRALKPGGVFHSKIHCFDYGLRLLNAGLISPKLPYEGRETRDEIEAFIAKHGKVRAFYRNNDYVIESVKDPDQFFSISPEEAFLYHNAVAAMPSIKEGDKSIKQTLNDVFASRSIAEGYEEIRQNYLNQAIRMPHQHNADYWGQEEFKRYLLELGYSEVYFTQPYQSVSSALWEDALNPLHFGFLFAVEAVK